MAGIDFALTIKIIIIAVVAFLVITAWDEVLDRLVFKLLKLDKNKISSWVVVAVIMTVLLFIIMAIFKIQAHDILGISDDVRKAVQTKM